MNRSKHQGQWRGWTADTPLCPWDEAPQVGIEPQVQWCIHIYHEYVFACVYVYV